MGQVSYGTITITDTNDIERIYMEYAQSSSNSTAPTTGWSENIPAWEQGKYIWQRTVVKKEGVALSSDSYGDPVCLTGSTGSTGSPGATGRGVSSIVTTYCNYGTGTPAANYSGWSSTVPAYDSTEPNYWIKTVITYTSGTPVTDTKIYQDNGITSATATAANAKTQAAAAEGKADSAVSTANTANTNASNALSIANGVNQHFWSLAEDTTTTGGTLAAGQYITDILQSSFKQNPNSSGNLLLRSDGVYLNLGLQTLASFKSNALTFYNSAGAELGKFGSDGLEMSGTLNIKGGGRIGQDSTNYWQFGDNVGYNVSTAAYLIGKGNSSIQLGENGHWRIDKNRIHTGWYVIGDSSSSTPAGSLHFDTYNVDRTSTSSGDQYYWDYGLHFPISNTTPSNNKFLYIRYSKGTVATTTLSQMKGRIDNDNYWNYKFYIDDLGNVHAPGFYIGESTTPIGGGAGTVAERLTQGYGSASQPIYFNSNGVPTNTTYQLNAAGAKGVDTSISAASTSTNLPTSQAVAAFVEGKGYITSYVDNKVQTSQANTTKVFLAGTSTTGTSTGTLNFDSNVYLTTTAGTLHATTFEGNLSGTASRATADGDGNTISTTYLKLSGGNVTGAVSFGSSVSADELTVGDLVVNGAASFTNNLQANTINGVAVGSNPKFTDTVTTVTVTGNGNAVTSASASNGAVTLTKGATFLTSYTETDPIFVASAAHGISSTDISNWNSKTSNTGTVTKVTAGTGLKIGTATSGGDITTTGTINHINSVTAKTAAAQSAKTLTWGGTFTLYEEKYDAQGHITGVANYNMTMPANPNTHNTAYLYAGKSDGTTNAATTNGNTYLILMDGGSVTTRRKVSGDGTVSVASDANGNITVTGSAHPTSLKNPNALSIKVYNGSSTSTDTSYDGSTANQSVSVAGIGAITSVGISGSTLSWTKADGTTGSSTVTITASVASGSKILTDSNGNALNVGSTNKPVYFSGGVPVTLKDGTNDLTIGKSVPSDAKFTDTWIAMVGATSSANGTAGYVSAPPKDGYNTKFLRADGTWVVPGGTYSLPLAANGTRGGVQIGYSANGKNYPVQLSSEKMYVNVPWTDTNYYHKTGSWSGLTYTAAKVGSPDDLAFTIPTGATSTTVAIGNHTHGNITNGGDITATAPTIANGDQLVINDNSEGKITNGPTFDGSTTTKALTPKGTWETFSQFSGSYNDLADKPTIPTVPSNIVNTITTTAGAHTVISNKTGNVSFNVPTTAAHVGIKFGYTTSGNNRAVLQDASGNLYVTQKDDNTNYYHTTGSWGGTNNLTYTATANGGAGALAFTLATASTSVYGVTKLSSTASSTEQGLAATPKLVYDSINNATNKYVTLDTNQTLTAAGTKIYLGLQTYGSNGVAFGTTSGTSVTQKANVKYDATLDALVFTFA